MAKSRAVVGGKAGQPGPLGVRLRPDLKAALSTAAAHEGRSLHAHIVHVLEASLGEQPLAATQPVTTWARSVAHVFGLLARDCEHLAQTEEEALVKLKIAAPVLLEKMLGSFSKALGADYITETETDARPLAEALAVDLATKLLRPPRKPSGSALADKLANDADRQAVLGQPSLGRSQAEIEQIRAGLHLPEPEGDE